MATKTSKGMSTKTMLLLNIVTVPCKVGPDPTISKYNVDEGWNNERSLNWSHAMKKPLQAHTLRSLKLNLENMLRSTDSLAQELPI